MKIVKERYPTATSAFTLKYPNDISANILFEVQNILRRLGTDRLPDNLRVITISRKKGTRAGKIILGQCTEHGSKTEITIFAGSIQAHEPHLHF